MTECAVCHQNTPKSRVHYGGVSCYSCRAFFRRNTQRDEVPPCKERGECDITYVDRKLCTACRYQKCLRVGMTPCLVLNEDDKRIRFKKLNQKKKEELIKFIKVEAPENQEFCQVMGKDDIESQSEDEEKDDDNDQAQNYTKAFLTIQQYRAEYLQQIKASAREETSENSSDEVLDPTNVNNVDSLMSNYSDIQEETDENLETEKLNKDEETKALSEIKNQYLVKVENNQRFRQLLELSHKAAIYAKLKDTDFPTIVMPGFADLVIPKIEDHSTDFSLSDEDHKIKIEEFDIEAVSSVMCYPTSTQPEQDREDRLQCSEEDKLEEKYSHKKFRTYQEQQDITKGIQENRKRKSVIVQGPKCKKECSQFYEI